MTSGTARGQGRGVEGTESRRGETYKLGFRSRKRMEISGLVGLCLLGPLSIVSMVRGITIIFFLHFGPSKKIILYDSHTWHFMEPAKKPAPFGFFSFFLRAI